MKDYEKALLQDFQGDFPLEAKPYASIAKKLHISEDEVIESLGRLRREGIISRVGAIVAHAESDVQYLAAMRIAPEQVEECAATLTRYREISHVYEREHPFNLWFIVHATDGREARSILDEVSKMCAADVLSLAIAEDHHQEKGVVLKWS